MDDTFPPIDAYGVVGNDDRCALVGRNGSIDWWCVPHLESPSVFAAILDAEDGGRFAVRPSGTYDASQTYVDRTNVLETTFETDSGSVTVTDFMPARDSGARVSESESGETADEGEPSRVSESESETSTAPETERRGGEPDERFQQALYRKVEGLSGAVDLEVVFQPRFDYARSATDLDDDGDVVVASGDHEGGPERDELALYSDVELAVDADDAVATATVTVEAGETRWFRLEYGTYEHHPREQYESILEGTIDYWRTWLDGCEESAAALFEFDERWRDALVRSALVLKLLIHEETGSIPAAPTTSLPEEIGGELNWDYRYNWIRDAKFTVQALYNVGQAAEARRYFEWFREIGHEEPADIQPLYGLHSETGLDEETLDHLSGYRDSTPVRIGNAAADQDQLDIYGTIVQGIYETIRYENGLSDYDWESVRALADYVCDHWDERDKSIWEFRDLHEHFVHSKLLCWVALDRAIRLAEEYDREGPIDRWDDERAAIRESILDRGYDEELGSFVQHFDADGALDATALLIPLYDFLPPDDERVQNTIDTIIDELTTDDGLVFRFAGSEARPREPGGFVLCSFWLVDALVVSGRVDEAEALFDDLLEHTSPLGLLSEMIRPDDGAFLGNFPQAFSHIGLLNSALYLASANDDAEELPPEELGSSATTPLFRRHGS